MNDLRISIPVVIRRTNEDGDLLAIFPTMPTIKGECQAFEMLHRGGPDEYCGFTSVSYPRILSITKEFEVSTEESSTLLEELEALAGGRKFQECGEVQRD
jgi:hypothetical protein